MISTLLKPKPRLGDILVERGHLTREQLEDALAQQTAGKRDKLLGEVLIEGEFCPEESVLECVAEDCGIPFLRLDARVFDTSIFDSLPREFVERNTVLPLFRIRNKLIVAVSEPTNVFLIDQIEDLASQSTEGRCQVELVLASAKDIRRAVQTYMPNTEVFVIDDIIDDASGDTVELIEETIEDLRFDFESADQSPIIRLVNFLIVEAVREGASDIHIEPTDRLLRVRYRIDGVLRPGIEPPPHLSAAIASRVKIMAGLDISERRLPQDGRVHVMMEGRPIDLRVSTLPMANGEKIVMRVMDQQSLTLSLENLGFSADLLEGIHTQISQPNGIALVTGPTGSGKSTTLYSALAAVVSPETNVCTVEDPVEARLGMTNQFQVNDKIGLDFPTILRSLLRQDPDVIMVGEIRDEETAKVATQAALTGHLVLSTLHTNDAISAVTRLGHMGIENFLLAASLNMVLAQRLVRKVCDKCKVAYEPAKPIRAAVEQLGFEFGTYLRGAGCKRCRNTGYSGRIGIHELLVVDETLRQLITENAPQTALKAHIRETSMVCLRYDGFRKVREGLTTAEEVVRVSQDGWAPKGC